MKYIYLIIVDYHYDRSEYYFCATEAAADKLFQKIVKEKYFDPEKDTEEDFKRACSERYWESQHKDMIMVSKRQALTEEEI